MTRPAICESCHLVVRRLLDVRAGEMLIVELEPWIDEDGREHWTAHDCHPVGPEDLQPAEQYL